MVSYKKLSPLFAFSSVRQLPVPPSFIVFRYSGNIVFFADGVHLKLNVAPTIQVKLDDIVTRSSSRSVKMSASECHHVLSSSVFGGSS